MMIHHTMRDEGCYNLTDIAAALTIEDTKSQIKAFEQIQMYVLITVLVLLLQLGYLMKPFAYGFFRLFSWFSYFLVPALISYILGLMGQPRPGYGLDSEELNTQLRYLTCIWAIFLLFAYAGLDNLNAFSIEERNGRSKLVLQLVIQFILLILILRHLPTDTTVVPIAGVFLVLSFKFVERLVALAHSDGATPGIKRGVAKLVDFTHKSDENPNAKTMEGFKYLVGTRYITHDANGKKIEDGITLEKLWGCEGGLFSNKDDKHKDSCLSFALFWLLLGKFWSYPLYEQGMSQSRVNARKLVRDGLLANKDNEEKVNHERVFRVIEVELAFLRDYFHAKYIFFYLNGFRWKLVGVIASPIMFWWFTQKAVDYEILKSFAERGYGNPSFTAVANTIVIFVILALEALQLVMFLTSRWFEVTMLCYYVERKTSRDTKFGFPCWFLEKIGSFLLGSTCNKAKSWWRKPWKRELEQYSLIESCTKPPVVPSFLKLHLVSVLGLTLPKAGRRADPEIKLSEQVKEALVKSLITNDFKLSNGATSLRRNKLKDGVVVDPSWYAKNKKDTELILIWHIATCFCDMHSKIDESDIAKSLSDFDVAMNLSNYCSYLLFFASSLLPVPALEAESICDDLIEEARELFETSSFTCSGGDTVKTSSVSKYAKMKELIAVQEVESQDISVLKSGVRLGKHLVTSVSDYKQRWKILAEFWAEMILYLAPSDSNETAHAETLSEGGEFITHLWALLIHAGITDRDEMAIFQEHETRADVDSA